jgi:TRAP-type C4-dicarboxylate transport system permease small subunit
MSRKLLATLLIVGFLALIIYFALRWNAPPSGIETKGSDASLTVQYLSLATAIVSLLTAIVGLLKGTVKKGSGAET